MADTNPVERGQRPTGDGSQELPLQPERPRRRGQRRVLHPARELRQPQRAAVGMAHPHPRENQARHGRGPTHGTTAYNYKAEL